MKCVFVTMMMDLVMVVVTLNVVLMVKPGQAAFTCAQVDSNLIPCLSYLRSGGQPSGFCCDGVRNLKNMTPTTADRQAACNCIKEAASRYRDIKDDAASSLPAKCRVQSSVPISKNIDCSRVQ